MANYRSTGKMTNRKNKHPFTPGLPPGTIVDREQTDVPLSISITDYQQERIDTRSEAEVSAVAAPPEGVERWVRVRGTPTAELVRQIGLSFAAHPLVQEDIMSTDQRIKVEDYESLNFTVLRTIAPTRTGFEESELSIILTERTLITIFESDDASFFAPVAARLANPGSLLRHHRIDFLYHAIVDLVVDCYFPVVQSLEELGSETEERILNDTDERHLRAIHTIRSSSQRLRSTLWSTRDVISRVERSAHRFVRTETLFYFRDISDHVVHLLDALATMRDAANGMMELYMSGVSHRMNQIMKVLTIISTLFIPITFIAGVYGMNFLHMPELSARWAYPVVLGVMGAVVVAMLIFFRRKRWF